MFDHSVTAAEGRLIRGQRRKKEVIKAKMPLTSQANNPPVWPMTAELTRGFLLFRQRRLLLTSEDPPNTCNNVCNQYHNHD